MVNNNIDLTPAEADNGPGKPKSGTPTPLSVKPSTPIIGASQTVIDPTNPTPPDKIPLPNYADPTSRLNYAQQWTKKYGPLMQGRGDTPLRINETPDTGSDTSKNLSTKAAKSLGLDPALLYSSAMEEGMSGLYPGKKGDVDYSGDEKFPVSGYVSFGLDTFADKFPDLVKKGYLTQDFAKNFNKSVETNEQKTRVNSANFKDADSALQAKAALMKMTYDDIDSYSKKRGIPLSPKARDFFALADYNGGEGTGHQMLNDYYNNGQLEGDKFLQARPTSGKGLKADSYKGIYENVNRRLLMRDALKKEGLFE